MKPYAVLMLLFLLTPLAWAQKSPNRNNQSVTVNWDRPTEYVDGSQLNRRDIRGYILYYGTQSGMYYQADYYNKSANRATVRNLAPGVYYFAIVVELNNGELSDYSNEVIRVVGNQ